MMGFNLPHKANVGEIIRVKGYESILFLVLEYTEEIGHEVDGTVEETVTYTVRNIDNAKEIKIVFDQDVISIVVTADKAEEYMAKRQGQAQPPAIREQDKPKTDVSKLQIDVAGLLKHFEDEKKRRAEQSGKTNNNNAPRSPWAKEREAKRIAYEYIDFLLERYGDLISMQQVMPNDKEIQAEIDLVRAEFMEKSGAKVVQDGKFS